MLKSRYDRPRLIQRTHVQLTPSLKEGNGRELRKLHNAIQQHVRALGNLGCELPGKFITSMIELKLDVDTLFEWQKHSQAETSVPHYQALLDFIDMRAQAVEVSCATHKTVKRLPSRVTSHATHSHHDKNCVACKINRCTFALLSGQCLRTARCKC